MQTLKGMLCCLIGLALSAGASAQIYESKDAQGNTVYSDKPSQGSAAVKLPATNSADPVAERPRPAPDSSSETAPQGSSQRGYDDAQEHGSPYNDQQDSLHNHDDSYYYGGTYNKNTDADSRNERKEQRRNNANRPNQDLPGRASPGRKNPSSDTAGSKRSTVDRGSTTIRPAAGMRGR